MGILDHSKTWRFTVYGSAADCERAFQAAMSKSPGLKLRAVKWGLRPIATTSDATGASVRGWVATYEGRAGLAAFGTAAFGPRAAAAERVAIGSKITFAVEAETVPGRHVCAMWLSSAGTKFGLTGDAGYFRSYMADVEKQLRELDPRLELVKS